MAFYTRIHEEHWLRDKLEEGKIVILEDESIWEVHPSDRQITKRWLRISITVKTLRKMAIRISFRTAPRERMRGPIISAILPGRASRPMWLNPDPQNQRQMSEMAIFNKYDN